MKDATDEEVRPIALVAQRLCHEAGATFIIDDRVGLVRELHADGVHLGQNDMPIREARRLLGDGFIIGGTANTFDQVRAHYESSADYIGCGPFRFTTTKQKLAPVLGLDGYRTIISEMEEAHIHIPIVAIGGITEEDIPDILQTGVSGIALSGTVLRADDPVQKMKQLINTVNHE
jgi:thiamine-phosphate pyrophosphorylase